MIFLKDGIKKMLDRADQMNHPRISTSVIKSVFSASTDDQLRHAMKQLEGENRSVRLIRKHFYRNFSFCMVIVYCII